MFTLWKQMIKKRARHKIQLDPGKRKTVSRHRDSKLRFGLRKLRFCVSESSHLANRQLMEPVAGDIGGRWKARPLGLTEVTPGGGEMH